MSKNGLDDFLNSLKAAAGGTQGSSEGNPVKKQKITKSLMDPSRMGKNGEFGYTEINKFEHCARSLQKNIRTIVNEAPTLNQVKQYAADETIDSFARSEAKTNPLLRLVAKLKSNYKSSQLKIFDEILENNVSSNESYGGNHDTIKSKDVTKIKGDSTANDEGDESNNSKKGLPPLPKIKSAELRSRVFQHKSTSAHKTYLNDSEIVSSHNERLEFLGDSVLNNIVTRIIYNRFPTANEGQLSQMRSVLVSNKTLGEFSIAYGFDKQLRCNIDEETLKSGPQKVFADVFEAYTGALATERGYDLVEVEQWLKALMANKIALVGQEYEKTDHVNKEAKTELYSLIGSAYLHPIYKVIESGNGFSTPFKVQCLMEDVVMGEGEAPSLKDAGLRAAMSALSNKEMLEFYGRKRLETDRSVSEVKQPISKKMASDNLQSRFPLVADQTILANKFAKNEAYAYFGKNLGLSPEYSVVFEDNEQRYKAELKVKDVVVSIAYDASKKNAISRAAAVLLENRDLLHEIVSLIN